MVPWGALFPATSRLKAFGYQRAARTAMWEGRLFAPGEVFGEFPDGYVLTGATEKILFSLRAGVMPRFFPHWGNDAPTTAREWDLPSHGALTLFFRWRKKSVQKKASGTALQRRPAPLRVAGFGLR